MTGMVAVRDNRLVPVVSALTCADTDRESGDSYQSDSEQSSDNSEDQVSSVSCRSSSPASRPADQCNDTQSLSTELAEDEEESSPHQATPNSAMSISPANSEVGSRLNRSNSSTTSSSSSLPRNTPYRPPKAHYPWGKNKKGAPDRADLDNNWRASASSGPGSDKSSNSGNERETVVSGKQRSSGSNVSSGSSVSSGGDVKNSSSESRADLDTNWREHHMTNTLPPTGAKGKGKVKNQKSVEKGVYLQISCQQNINHILNSVFLDISNQSETPKSRLKTKQDGNTPRSSDVANKEMKPMNAKLDIIKLRSVVERNILDNDRLQQKAEARKSSDGQQSRLDVDNKVEATKKSTESIDNSKHHSNDDSKLDNFQLVESGRNAANKKKKKKKKSERPDCTPSQKAALSTGSDCRSDDFDAKNANSKVANRFSCVAGPRLPKR